MLSAFWTFNSTTTSPPAAGQVRSNAGPTNLWVHETDADGFDRSAGLATITVGTTIYVRAANGTDANYLVSGTPVDNGVWWTFPITVLTGVITKGARTQLNFIISPPYGIPTGGTTGQVLNKTSNADYATAWTTITPAGIGAQAVDSDLTTIAGLTATTDSFLQSKASAWTTRTVAQVKTDLGLTGTNSGDQTTIVGITGTTAQFNTALSDNDFATLAGTETLTNKTLTAPVITESINAQVGTTYTFVLTDASKLVTMSNAAAITATVPPNSTVAFPVGTMIDLAQIGAGKVTVAQGAGVTVNGTPSLGCRAQYSTATLIKLATDTWLLAGDLA